MYLSLKKKKNKEKMDLLGSILSEMDAPPAANEEQRKNMRRQKEAVERYKRKQKEELIRYRNYVEERLTRFALDERPYIEFQPTDKVHRAVVHEVGEYGGFLVMSFPAPNMEKYAVIYKKEHSPCDDEITARRNGEGWSPAIAKEYADRRREERLRQQILHQNDSEEDEEEEQQKVAETSSKSVKLPLNNMEEADNNNTKSNSASSSSAPSTGKGLDRRRKRGSSAGVAPTFNYQQKYAHLIGNDTSPCAVSKKDANRSYGFVPSQNKMDVRSIEQTMNELRAKKRQRLEKTDEEETETSEVAVVARLLRSNNSNAAGAVQRPGSIASALLDSNNVARLAVRSSVTGGSGSSHQSSKWWNSRFTGGRSLLLIRVTTVNKHYRLENYYSTEDTPL